MLRPKFNQNDIRKYFQAEKARVDLAILNMLVSVAEQFIADARSRNKSGGGFGDVTGNLRASIGYVIVKNQRIVFKSFPGKTEEGKEKARALVNRLLASSPLNHPEGYILCCVAGMQYAAAVEARGFSVISSDAFVAADNLKKGLARIKSKLDKKYGL